MLRFGCGKRENFQLRGRRSDLNFLVDHSSSVEEGVNLVDVVVLLGYIAGESHGCNLEISRLLRKNKVLKC